jgi:hypothetical protein
MKFGNLKEFLKFLIGKRISVKEKTKQQQQAGFWPIGLMPGARHVGLP